MRKQEMIFALILIVLVLFSCSLFRPKWKSVVLDNNEIESANLLNIEHDLLKQIKAKPLYKFTPRELDCYLGYLQSIEPDLRKRVQHLAKKSVGQPYQIFLLGEFPYEIYDSDPLYSLDKSDCVVFSEHMYAMALSYDWKSFFSMLQRIRYKDGEIGLATRNHYTEFDWDVNNNWLVQDITEELAGEKAVFETTIVDRARFLSRWGLGQMINPDTVRWSYIPVEILPEVIDQLKPGDFVNIVRGYENNKWVGHVGLITVDDDTTVNFLHSTSPKVKEQRLMELYETAGQFNEKRTVYNEKIIQENKKIRAFNKKMRERNKGQKSSKEKRYKRTRPYFYGFKFLRLREDPIWELMKIDGPYAPKMKTAPVFD